MSTHVVVSLTLSLSHLRMISDTKNLEPPLLLTPLHRQKRHLPTLIDSNNGPLKPHRIAPGIPQIREFEPLSAPRILGQAQTFTDVFSIQRTADGEDVAVSRTLLMQDPALSEGFVMRCGGGKGQAFAAVR